MKPSILIITASLLTACLFACSPQQTHDDTAQPLTDLVSAQTAPRTEAPTAESEQTSPPDTQPPETEAPMMIPEFISDLSEYEEYMNPEDRDAYVQLIGVNNPLPQTYVPKDLVDIADTRDDGRDTQKMVLYAAKALEAFLIEARANGCENVTVTSAYRTYEYQNELFTRRVNRLIDKGYTYEEAYNEIRIETAIPGTSEHQSGLCCDMHNMSSAVQSFADTYEAKWLKENCWKFGFILRFPEDKEEETGIIFEPWHFRYVGRYHAAKIYESGLCLEEYTEYLQSA